MPLRTVVQAVPQQGAGAAASRRVIGEPAQMRRRPSDADSQPLCVATMHARVVSTDGTHSRRPLRGVIGVLVVRAYRRNSAVQQDAPTR